MQCPLTVTGALGIPSIGILPHHPAMEYTFVDTMVAPNVQHAFQALALDEHRLPFSPTIWETPAGRTDLDLRQCWFPGVHSNIGGGYPDTMMPDITLAWMVSRRPKPGGDCRWPFRCRSPIAGRSKSTMTDDFHASCPHSVLIQPPWSQRRTGSS